MLVRAALLAAAPFGALFLLLLIGVSSIDSRIPALLVSATVMALSFGGTLQLSGSGALGGSSGGGSASIFAMLLVVPVVISLGQHVLHRRTEVPEGEALGYALGAAAGASISVLILALLARSSNEGGFGDTSFQGSLSVNVVLPIAVAGLVAGMVAWRGSQHHVAQRIRLSLVDFGRLCGWLLALVAVLAVGAVGWVTFQHALGKESDGSLNQVLLGLGGLILVLPNLLFVGLLLLAGATYEASWSASAGVPFFGLGSTSSGDRVTRSLPWEAQAAFLVLVIALVVLTRRRTGASRWWENAAVFATLGMLLAWATHVAFNGSIRASILGASGGERLGINPGTAIVRMGVLGGVIGLLAHPQVMAATEGVAQQIRSVRSWGVFQSLRAFWGRLVPRQVTTFPKPAQRLYNIAFALVVVWVLALGIGNFIRIAGNNLTTTADDRINEFARVIREGDGAKAAEALGLDIDPISSPGAEVTIKKTQSGNDLVVYTVTFASGTRKASQTVYATRSFTDGPFFGLVPKWAVFGASLPRVSGDGSSEVVIDGQPLSSASGGRRAGVVVMPGSHRVQVSGKSPYIKGVDENIEILESREISPDYTVTPEGQQVAANAVNAYLRSCGARCPGIAGYVVTAVPSSYDVVARDGDTVRVTSRQSGRYSYGSSSSYYYGYSLDVTADVTFSGSESAVVDNIVLD